MYTKRCVDIQDDVMKAVIKENWLSREEILFIFDDTKPGLYE